MRTLLAVVLTFLAFTIAEAGKYQFPANGQRVTVASGTYADGQKDTLIIIRESNLAAISIALSSTDTLILDTATAGTIYRSFNGAILALVAADTLSGFTDYTVEVGDSLANECKAGNITLQAASQPLPDQFIVIIDYAEAGNGTLNPTVYYTVSKQFYR